MKPIGALIIDDELPSIKSLIWELEGQGIPVEVLASCTSAQEGLAAIREHEPELVFLDIELPHMNAFEMLSELPIINFQIIFTTAYDNYAVKAFEVNACDYLLKPVDNEMLTKALQRFIELRDFTDISRKLEGLFASMQQQKPGFPKLAVSTMEGLEFIKIENIVRCESSSNYTYVYTIDGKSRIVSRTLGDIQQSLEGHHFHRVHKSHLVNIMYVQKYIRGKAGYLILDDGTSIPVSKAKKGFLDEI
jgi:two-component system LytT family response regulator